MTTIQPQITGRAAPVSDAQRLALTIPEFCITHGISEAFFYKLQKEGKGPRTMSVGRRRLISIEAAKQWREECTSAA
jgi:predicted DNA-binding transcriptional regulator AlpA